MVTINCAYTEPINPSGASPVLTREQVWKGLQRKIRKAQDFVPIISGTDVLEERDDGREVVREAHFIARQGIPAQTVREVCRSYYPARVDFWQPSGALITNTVSDGPDGGLYMIYTFEWRHDVAEGSKEHKELAKQHSEGAAMAVHKSIEALREMAIRGELD